MPKLLEFRCAVVVIDVGDEIGKAIARYFVSQNKKVLIAGRIESQLQSTTREVGAYAYYVVDMGSTTDIMAFVKEIIRDHPELDCIVNNANVQRPLQALHWLRCKDEFLAKADAEIDIQVRGPMCLTMELVSHLQTKKAPVILNVFIVLGYLPFAFINPIYVSTKAWLHHWTMSLRTQLQLERSPIRVVEVAPPEVNFHHGFLQKASTNAESTVNWYPLTVEDFMRELVKLLEADGEEMLFIGPSATLPSFWLSNSTNQNE
ncbi:hypothetical protein BB8028_0012g00160 [Beauveria bassiana]|uniref:Uncharacterized protein n=1 Tax=Beauveria bassiana TaxID=176275 RepID=A0A2S7YQ38_BEABA|nr:hypothetical protein BB8028_0012g00160 [Beauveria bassiana]